MKTPSIVSMSDMPAAKMNGSAMMASGGSAVPPLVPAAAAVADSPSTAISVAVSKPRPNRMPTGYICHELVMNLFVAALEDAVHEAPLGQQDVELLLLVRARLGLTPHLHDAEEHGEVECGDEARGSRRTPASQ